MYRLHHEEHEGGGGGGDDAVVLTTVPSGPAAGVAPSSGVVHAYCWATVAVVSSDASSGTRSATIRWAAPRAAQRATPLDEKETTPHNEEAAMPTKPDATRLLRSKSRVNRAVEAEREKECAPGGRVRESQLTHVSYLLTNCRTARSSGTALTPRNSKSR